ncbi:sensor histidine kinase [Cohnella cholangitidis]|uniref:Heme sensor protein HssS n=1 Tax=Cohnella cholangitidis TaxID=2598458 RepID=A0A7G5C608_9BACL|nr:sensor histidine kinase [Cohnella cholangitidis]QMV44642.1 HAMP domain-containing protein [Cohnella cholangitidis]
MIKSLYFRVVLTYMIAVIVGLVSTYFLSLYLLDSVGDRYANKLQADLVEDGKSIQEIYRLNGVNRADEIMKTSSYSDQYEIRLYDQEGKLMIRDGREPADLYIISDQIVRSVLNGEEYKGIDVSPTELIIGFPYVQSGNKYALFVQVSESTVESFAQILIVSALLINLFFGIVVIIIGARYLVKPLRGMRAAAERMAKGEFDIELKWGKRKDELGQLAQSFNYMASQMKQLESMRQDFVSNVSHEIQSPLTSISGFSKALQESNLSDEERSRYLSIIQNESERLSRLSDNLLKLASLDSKRHPFEPRIYDLDEQLRKAVVSLEPQWSAKSIEWRLNLPKTKIVADEDQMNQVWNNVIGNSIKFTPAGGQIGIGILKHVDLIEIVITDNGIGIPPEEHAKVFERFYKSDQSHNKKHSGSGLGLAIVKKIVTRHRGAIELKNNPNGGTIAVVRLPNRI